MFTMTTTTTTTVRRALLLAGAVGVLAAPAATQAQQANLTASGVPPVLNAPKALLSPTAAARAQAKARKTGHFPAPPRFATQRGLRRGAQTLRGSRPLIDRRRGKRIVNNVARKPSLRKGKLFGYVGDFDSKRLVLLNWVNYVYRITVPGLGGTFQQPSIYELPGVGTTPNGCPVANGVFCWGSLNTVAWSAPWLRGVFDTYGDGAAGAFLAHEYGHGAMSWLGWTGRGEFRYELYREGFADCMAGGWLYWMYAHNYTDGLGRGDANEMLDGMQALSDRSTDTVSYSGHGDRAWRYGAALYGWNYGFQGCATWGRNIAAGTAG